MNTRSTWAVAGLLTLGHTAVFLGLGVWGTGQALAQAAPPTTKLNQAEECSFDTSDREYPADCGLISVPADRHNHTAKLLEIPVTRIRALSPRPGTPIFLLEDGPGLHNNGHKPTQALMKKHDVVMVGYRGVDGYTHLTCEGIGEALLADKAALGQTTQKAVAHAVGQCLQQMKNDGLNPAGFTLEDIALDIDVARDKLGYAKIDLLALGMGSRIAQVYAAKFPERVERMVWLAPQLPGDMVPNPQAVDATLAAYADLCHQDAACNARSPNIQATIKTALDKAPDHWMLLELDRGRVLAMSQILLQNTANAAKVLDAYQAAGEGNYAGLAAMSYMYDSLAPKIGLWGHWLALSHQDMDPRRDYAAELLPGKYIVGTPIHSLMWNAAAPQWPVAPMAPGPGGKVQAPTLVVVGSLGYAPMASRAKAELMPLLSQGQWVEWQGMGHLTDLWHDRQEEMETQSVRYLETGVMDPAVFAPRSVSLKVSFGFAGLALAGMSSVAVFITMGLLALGFLARRYLR